MNKHADMLIGHLQEAQKSFDNKQNEEDRRAEEDNDTMKLVRAIMRGEGIRSERPSGMGGSSQGGSSQGSKRPA